MNRNVTILVIILAVLVIAGYLIWLRSRFNETTTVAPMVTPTIMPTVTAEPTIMEATPTASPSGSAKVTPKVTPKVSPTKAASGSGTVR